jgi:NADH:ubiquinone oxidoreductase subunit B-like Fe-S oxidoreductase
MQALILQFLTCPETITLTKRRSDWVVHLVIACCLVYSLFAMMAMAPKACKTEKNETK